MISSHEGIISGTRKRRLRLVAAAVKRLCPAKSWVWRCVAVLAVMAVGGCQTLNQFTGKNTADWCYFENDDRVLHRIDSKATDCTSKGGHWITDGQADLLRQEKLAAGTTTTPPISFPIHECDRLATHPHDPKKVTAGVYWNELDAAPAISACQKAVQQFPKILRFQYLYGRSIHKSKQFQNAFKLYVKLAEQGYVGAQSSLAHMYEMGEGTLQDYVRAHMWWNISASQGTEDAERRLSKLSVKMSLSQIEEAQKLAQNFVARITPPLQGKKNPKQIVGKSKPEQKPLPQATTNTFPNSHINVRFALSKTRPDDIAVIIGNANYKKQGKDIPDVTPAYADAEGMKRYVKQALGIDEDNIIFLKDASQGELATTFGSATNPKGQLFNYVKAGKSRVFVYYSGHGAPSSEDGSSYIVPTDAQASMIDLNGYSLSTLYKNLSLIPAKSVTVVLEACFSGASQSGSVITKASPIYLKAKETSIPPNITVISAGAANQIASWEQDSSSGLFTKYFLKGMSGEADAAPYGNGDGKVDYDELGAYFKDTLTYYARRYYGREQTPQIVVGAGG
jgi:TPR repeat protein